MEFFRSLYKWVWFMGFFYSVEKFVRFKKVSSKCTKKKTNYFYEDILQKVVLKNNVYIRVMYRINNKKKNWKELDLIKCERFVYLGTAYRISYVFIIKINYCL